MTNQVINEDNRLPFTGRFGTTKYGSMFSLSRVGPNWSAAAWGADEPHPYTMSKIELFQPLVPVSRMVKVVLYYQQTKPTKKYPVYGWVPERATATCDSFIYYSYPPGITTANYWSIVDQRLAAKIRGAGASVLVTAGEAGETVAMLSGALRRLTGFLWSLYKGRWRDAATFLFPKVPRRTIRYHSRKFQRNRKRMKNHRLSYASTVLEYEFGWRPLMHDIEECQKALVSTVFKTKPVKVSAAYKVRGRMSIPATYVAGVNKYSRRLRNTLWLDKAISGRAEWGLTGPDLIGTIYNLIPFTWMLDWVVNLNGFLDSWAVSEQVKVLRAQRSTLEQYYVGDFAYIGVNTGWHIDDSRGMYATSVKYTREKAVSTWALTPPRMRSVSEIVNFRHLIDTLAVARQRLRGISFSH